MKLNIFVYKNLTLGASCNPIFKTDEPDILATQLKREVLAAKEEEIAHLVNTEFYFIGSYDDETLRFQSSDPVLLIDFNQILDERKIKYELLKKIQEAREAKKESEKNGKSC